MAYVSQELKAKLAPQIKAVLKKYDVKATISVRHHSTLVVNVKSSGLNFVKNFNDTVSLNYPNRPAWVAKNYIQVNPYHFDNHFTGDCLEFLKELKEAMMVGNHNNSDSMSDYFDVGWYIDINIGKWDKPYEYVGQYEEIAVS